MKKYTRVLTIAGSDSGGSAGIQADLKTFAALDCFGMSAITCLTAQNTKKVTAVYPLSAEIVRKQIEAVISDIGVDAIKIGMLYNTEIVNTVAEILSTIDNVPVVLDPVMVATSGDMLLEPQTIAVMQKKLFKLATVITPNLREAATLLQQKIDSRETLEQAAKDLCKLGAPATVIKGGHFEKSHSADCLYLSDQNKLIWLEANRIDTKNIHGSGCTFAAAIATFLAKGFALLESVQRAKNYIHAAISAGSFYKIGSGYGPVYHNVSRS